MVREPVTLTGANANPMPEIFDSPTEWQAQYESVWLAHYEANGAIDWSLYPRPRNQEAVGGPSIPLAESRLLFVTSAGAYLPAAQEPFAAENDLGDYGIRTIPSDTPLTEIAYAHTHYPHDAVDADPQVLLPLRHLESLRDEGLLGELAPDFVSFMGYQPDVPRVVAETAPRVVAFAKEAAVRAALLVPA